MDKVIIEYMRSRIKTAAMLLSLALFAACGDEEQKGEKKEEILAESSIAEDRIVELTAAQVANGGIAWEAAKLGTIANAMALPGVLEPNENRTARLGAPVSGRIIAVAVSPGDRVQQGAVLVRLSSPEAGTAQADVSKARAELNSSRAQAAYARSARTRAERLLTLKAIPQQDYEKAVADDEFAQAALSQADAELRRAVATAQQLGAASATGQMYLRAPFAGVVLQRNASPGAVVEPGTPLVTVTDPTQLWLVINAPATAASSFALGTQVSFSVPAFGARNFVGRVQSVGAGLDPQTRTMPVRAVVDNRNRSLQPGMFATVSPASPSASQVVTVPAEAVQILFGKNVVFVAQPQSKGVVMFTAREVKIGQRQGTMVALESGLAAGEVVVVRGAFAVKAEIEKGSMPEMEM